MVWGCMSAKGLGTLHFIESTVNAAKYQDILEHSLLPSAARLHPSGDFIFQPHAIRLNISKNGWENMILKFCHIPLAARILIQ